MGLGICLDERYEPVACMVHNSADALLTPIFAMPVIVLQDDDRLSLALAGMFDIASVKVTVAAVIPANWADAFLFGQQLSSIAFPLVSGHTVPLLSPPRSQLTSTSSTSARALSS